MPKLIVISGPTASGKTSLSIKLAQKLACPILSADSRQIYKELNIGVAKPNNAQLSMVEHHLIGEISIHDEFDTVTFVEVALERLDQLFAKHEFVVLVGGTGLYINALLYGIDDMPGNDAKIAQELYQVFDQFGITALQQELKQSDPVYFNQVDKANHVRLMRALNVIRQTKRPFSEYRNRAKISRPFEFIHFNIEIPREKLYVRIDQRVDEMIHDGLEAEARQFEDFKKLQALQTVGYAEWWPYFDGEISLLEAVDKIKQHTRNYAKRQVTWFKKKETVAIPWSENIEDAAEIIIQYLNKN